MSGKLFSVGEKLYELWSHRAKKLNNVKESGTKVLNQVVKWMLGKYSLFLTQPPLFCGLVPSSSMPDIWYRSKPVRFLSTPRPKPSRVHWSIPRLFFTRQGKVTWSPTLAVWSGGSRRNSWGGTDSATGHATTTQTIQKIHILILSSPPLLLSASSWNGK